MTMVSFYNCLANLSNNHERIRIKNERIKNADASKGFVHIVDNVFGAVFAVIAFVVTAIVPFTKIASPLIVAIVVVATYISSFVFQLICYKIIKKQIRKLHRHIKNRKAWR